MTSEVAEIDPSGLTVYVKPDTLDGGYWVHADGRAEGCASQGRTIAEALENFADAYRAWSAVAREMRESSSGGPS